MRFQRGGLAFVIIGLGCTGPASKDEPCVSNRGTISGQLFTDFGCESTADDARVEFSQEGDEVPLRVRPDANGFYSVDLDPGDWEVRGFGWADSCVVEEPIQVTVVSCETVDVDVCADLCMDG